MAGNLLLQMHSTHPQVLQQQQQQQQQGAGIRSRLAQPRDQAACIADRVDDLVADHGIDHISVVDFSDGGVGDPLYDFVAVFVSVLRCDVDLFKRAVQSYSSALHTSHSCRAMQPAQGGCVYCSSVHGCAVQQQEKEQEQEAVDADQPQQQQQQQGVPSSTAESDHAPCCNVSKVFLVYLLLHEEGVMGQLLQQHPGLRCAGTLQAVEQQLFGWMSDVWPWRS